MQVLLKKTVPKLCKYPVFSYLSSAPYVRIFLAMNQNLLEYSKNDNINFMNECLSPILSYTLYTGKCYQFCNEKYKRNLYRLYSYSMCAIILLTTIRYIVVIDYYPDNFAKSVASFAYILAFSLSSIAYLQLNRIQCNDNFVK
jgi:hypothetical protein